MYRKIYEQGVEPKIFLNNFLEIIYYLKNFKNLKNLKQSIDFTDFDVKKIEDLSGKVDNKTLILFWEFSVNCISEINLISNQHLAVEMFLIRLLHLKKKFQEEKNEINQFNEKTIVQKNEQVDISSSKKIDLNENNNKIINQIKFSSQEKEKVLFEDKKLFSKIEIDSFSKLISTCIEKKEIGLKYELENNVNLISFKNNNIEISFNENLDKNFIKDLTSKLFDWTGERWIILLSKKIGSKSMKEIKKEDKNNKIQDLKDSEHFKNAINLFPDLEVTNIKDLEDK